MSSTQNITTIKSQAFIKLIFPNPVNFRAENGQKMIKFDGNSSCMILKICTLQKVRKWLFLKPCNLLNMNPLLVL